MIYLYVGVCFVLPWTVESFPFVFWRWRNKLKGHYEQKAMRDEGVIYVAGHPLLKL